MEQFSIEIKTFAALFLAGFGNDMAKATEALKKSNQVLADNPRIIPMLANEDNQKQIGEIITFIESGKGNVFTMISKVQTLAQNLKV